MLLSKFFFLFFGIKFIFSQTQASSCQSELTYYSNQYKSLQEERDTIATKLNMISDENKKISSALSEVQTKLNKIKREQIVIHASNWENSISSKTHTTIPELLKIIRVSDNPKLKVTSHFHFWVTKGQRLDVVTFLNGVLTGVETQSTESDLVHGMGITFSDLWISGTSFASKSVSAGDYLVEIKTQLPFEGTGGLSGVVTIIEIIYE